MLALVVERRISRHRFGLGIGEFHGLQLQIVSSPVTLPIAAT
jgi:hypothetical protein